MIASGFCCRQCAHGEREFPGAGDPDHFDILDGAAAAANRVERAGQQRLRDEAVEPAHHHRELQPVRFQSRLRTIWLVILCSSACENCLPFFQKCLRAFAPVRRCGNQSERHGFKSQSRLEAGIESRIHRIPSPDPTASGPFASTLPQPLPRGLQQIGRLRQTHSPARCATLRQHRRARRRAASRSARPRPTKRGSRCVAP